MSPASETRNSIIPPVSDRVRHRRRSWRMFKDNFARYFVAIGGVGAIVAILLIFFYLVYVVIPLFGGASMEVARRFAVPGGSETLHLSMDEQTEIGLRYTRDGHVLFFHTVDGSLISDQAIKLPANTSVTSFAAGAPGSEFAAFGLSNGWAIAVKSSYIATFVDGKRTITPRLEQPLGEAPIVVDLNGQALVQLAAQHEGEHTTLAAATQDNRVLLTSFERTQAMLGEDGELTATTREVQRSTEPVTRVLLNPEQRRLYIADRSGQITYVDIRDQSKPRVVHSLHVVESGLQITSLEFLSGGISLLVGLSDGTITQWFPVRDAHGNELLTSIRTFKERNAPINLIAAEYSRKGFIATDAAGYLGLYHSTAHRTLLVEPAATSALKHIAIAPRANALLAEDSNKQIAFWKINNEYPEVSWSSLWDKVWYESYDEPKWLWQSSASTNTFEPKFSFTPLAFGTFKAAFYAILVAVPLSLLGAIYTAQFMSPRMREMVKPTVEIMGAVPTVVLGFLAGLWLAPFIEKYLPGVFTALLLVPGGVLLFAYAWRALPLGLRTRVHDGWYAAVLIPLIIALTWAALAFSPTMELWWFGGDMRLWLADELGIAFDQRNSLIIGIAMGFAVTPTIFTIAEDALFSVPRQLINGSLALGATAWQTLWRVVLLTASPGIFSGVMIGLGRAIGETMIVLMATGNTPVMDFSVFSGMRTLSANIAVEMPEAELASTHYRLLFLAALVLFLVTFLFNTAAETVRQRLRRKYSSL
ncbi:MAG: ABC transporter permease subunit [Gammaproteobacteria bacterium]|nr:ABC transporter permease subunit [Gammaproteobacteria bacterium]